MQLNRLFIASLLLVLSSSLFAQNEGDLFSESGFNCKVLSADAAEKTAQVEILGGVETIGETLTIPAQLTHEFGGNVWTFFVTAIGEKAFAESKQLKNVFFPPLSESSISVIGPLAFHHCTSIASINLQDTRIEVLESLFTSDPSDEESLEDLRSLQLPETLKEIKPYALQFLGLRSITFPSSITVLGDRVLEGDIYLKEFIWENCQLTSLPKFTFWGNDKLELVRIMTVEPFDADGLTDRHFFMCDPNVLKVYVTKESYDSLTAGGYTNETARYSRLYADEQWTGIVDQITDNTMDGPASCHHSGIFTLQGVRVERPLPGTVYIKDGQKYIMK